MTIQRFLGRSGRRGDRSRKAHLRREGTAGGGDHRRRHRDAAAVLCVCLSAWIGVAGCGTPTTHTAGQKADEAVVHTDAGAVRGTVGPDYRLFEGIPFAAPPVGNLRWASPHPVAAWTGTRDATRPGNRCPQTARGRQAGSTDEDCLYLDVTAPRKAAKRPRPVMVWLHGGSDVGAGSDFDGRRLTVKGDVVLVTLNYRMTVFGNFTHPQLPGPGDFELQDQQAALRWVKRNAQAFGGDPTNVTLFGESRGSMDTCAQLTSPGAKGLFQRAILQSGPCNWGWPNSGFVPGLPASSIFVPQSVAQQAGVRLAKAYHCASVECLRKLPATGPQGLAKPENLGDAFSLGTYGNAVLPQAPGAALQAGRFTPVPVMIGSTKDENRLFVNDFAPPTTPDSYQALLRTAFADKAGQVAKDYPLSQYKSPDLAWAAVTTDQMFACRTLTTAQALARKAPTYSYEFADRSAPPTMALRQPPRLPLGAYHGADLFYTLPYKDVPGSLNSQQRRLSDQMISYWANFARTGNPNGTGLPKWPRSTGSGDLHGIKTQTLAPGPDGIKGVDLGAEHHCDLWSRIGQ